MAPSVPGGGPVKFEAEAFNEELDYDGDGEVFNEIVPVENSRGTDANPANQQASANSSAVADSSATADSTDDSISKENAVDASPAKVRRLGQQQSWHDMEARQQSNDSPGGQSWQEQTWQSRDNQTWQPQSWDNWTWYQAWSKRDLKRRAEGRTASRKARRSHVQSEEPIFSLSNVPGDGSICGEKRWTVNVGTESNPQLRQVCHGLFVYSDRLEQWVPHCKAVAAPSDH